MERAALVDLVRATGCAEACGGAMLLCDPRWGAVERAQVEVVKAEIRRTEDGGRDVESGKAGRGNEERRAGRKPGAEGGGRESEIGRGWLGVPTGGTSGVVRFARHDEVTLTAAARGFCAHFGLTRVNAIDVLPAFHVSGVMARVRCAEMGGRHVPWDWKRLEAGDRPDLAGNEEWVISLVPTQLQRLLLTEEARGWLREFRIIFVGGGPVWPALMDAAAEARLPISTSYGMTETAAMVAALRPEEFRAGARSSGAVLPHARIAVAEGGRITIGGESVFRGYFPEERAARSFETGDLGRFDERGHLHVLGRRDAVIITGGEKVEPSEVEAALRATGQFDDVAVIGLPDTEWGEVVVACFPDGGRLPDLAVVRREIEGRLAAFKRPKRYVAIAAWPRNAQGKLNRMELAALATRS